MIRRVRVSLALPSLLLAALLACSAPPSAVPSPPAPAPSASQLPTPARYHLTDRVGVMFDGAGQGAALPRPEPAIVDGIRLLVDNGVIVASAGRPDRLLGFRSLPERLGGGIVFWSRDHTYRAASFLDALEPIVDAGATGGVRPWLSSVLLFTPRGILELDPRTHATRRLAWPGNADALALDAQRGVRLDALGRASFTADGGAHWTDVLATRGLTVSSLGSSRDDEVLLHVESHEPLALDARGELRRCVEHARAMPFGDPRTASPLLGGLWPASSRALPGDTIAAAVAYGVPLPGGRVLVTREGGVRVLAVETGLPVGDADLAGIDERFARCQALLVGAPPRPALACVAETGAVVVSFEGSLTRLALEATFPPGGGGFIVGPGGRLAYDGRCGPEVPSSSDLGPGTPHIDETGLPPPEPGPVEPSPVDDARVCVRTSTGAWVERRLRGDDARHLYRWVPGDDGLVTALVLGGEPEDKPDAGASTPEGVRVLRLDPEAPALHGGAFPAALPLERDPPYRMADSSFWLDDHGDVRGWVRLPGKGEEQVATSPGTEDPTHRALRVATQRGGRSAGARIDAAGHLTVLGLPDGVAQVVTGGRFALATAPGQAHDAPAWFESLDGGATWAPIVAPPVGSLDAPVDEHTPFTCSELGCTWGGAVVRVGWNSPAPRVEPPSSQGGALAEVPARRPLVLRCTFDAEPWSTSPHGQALIGLRLSQSALGELRDHTWTGQVLTPFQPAAAARRLSMSDPGLRRSSGQVFPVLTNGAREPVDLLVVVDKLRLRARGGGPVSVRDPSQQSVAVELPDGTLAMLDKQGAAITLSRGALSSQVMRLSRVPGVMHLALTLGRGPAGVMVVGYSTMSGDVFAGELDLARGEVGPLAALPGLPGLSACRADEPAMRFLAELPMRVVIGGSASHEQDATVAALIAGSGQRLCLEGVETTLSKGSGTVLSARLGKAPAASVRSAGRSVRGTCTLGASAG